MHKYMYMNTYIHTFNFNAVSALLRGASRSRKWRRDCDHRRARPQAANRRKHREEVQPAGCELPAPHAGQTQR